MKMPEFTAEVSVYKTGNRYRQGSGFAGGNAVIVPQVLSICGDCTCDKGQCCKVNTFGSCQCYACNSFGGGRGGLIPGLGDF